MRICLENNHVRLGVERAKILATALKSVRVFLYFQVGKFQTKLWHDIHLSDDSY